MAKKSGVTVHNPQLSTNGHAPSQVPGGASVTTDLTLDAAAAARTTVVVDAQDLATWDLTQLRVSPDLTVEISGAPVLTTVEARKPRKQEWFRVRPGDAWRFPTSLLILEEERSVYLVAPQVQALLDKDVVPACLYTVVTRTGTLFLWPVRLVVPDKPSGGDPWYQSAHEAATLAETAWIRMTPATRGYDVRKATVLAEPVWPPQVTTMDELVVLAFRQRFIASPDHPVVRQLLEGI